MTAKPIDFATAFARPSWSEIEQSVTEVLTTSGHRNAGALDQLLRDHGYTRSRESDVPRMFDLLHAAELRADRDRGNA